MIGLLIKDTIYILKGLKLIIFVVLIYGAISFTGGDTSFFASMFTMVFALYVLNSYTYDYTAKWDMYALTLPITRNMMVKVKYYFLLLLSFVSGVICFLMTIIINYFLKIPVFQGIENIFIGTSLVLFAYSIILPLVIKLGVEKARILLAVVVVAPYAAIAYIAKELEAGEVVLPEQIVKLGLRLYEYSYVVVPVILALALFISYQISSGIYKKKEF